MLSEEEFKKNLSQVRKHIDKLCAEYKRKPEDVVLLPVTKKWPAVAVNYCQRSGLYRVGENRVQDALAKQEEIAGSQWELIGHLQSNKVKQVVGKFERIQTVDSMKLLEKLQNVAEQREVVCKVLLQVNSGEDPAKFGFTIDETSTALDKALASPNLAVEGLMTIAPHAPDDLSVARNAFGHLRDLRDRLKDEFNADLKELSMGMSGDLREAIESGSTMVRVGSSLFGERLP
jgi:PLP dependent protein